MAETVRIQAPNGAVSVSHEGVPYSIDQQGCFDVPAEVAPFFLRMEGFSEVRMPLLVPTPQPVDESATKPVKGK